MDTPLLILSATIQPLDIIELKLKEPGARRLQYLNAVSFWLRQPQSPRVVFVENSGVDLTEFREMETQSSSRLEVVGLPAQPYPADLGKGFGEFRMIDAAVERSRFVRDAEYFGKLTGRLTIRNLPAMWRRLPGEYDLVADAHLIPTEPNGGFADSRLVFFSTAFYRSHAIGLYQTMNDSTGHFAEHAIFRLMQTAPAAAKIWTRLPVEPHWQGASGTTGAAYDDRMAKLKFPFKRLRRVRDHWLGRPSVKAVRAAGASAGRR